MLTTQLACLGLSHHTAPVALRERLSCALTSGPAGAMDDRFPGLEELVVLSTCNRIEIYAAVAEGLDAETLLVDFLLTNHPVDISAFRPYLYFIAGDEVIRHLTAVAAGLDSRVLGEPQILGQVTEAYVQAVEARASGPLLDLLFRSAIRAGKRARRETAISSNPASISSVAIALAQEIAGDLRRRRILVVGAGTMAELALDALRKRGLTRVAIANRSRRRAELLMAGLDGPVFGLDELPVALSEADVVISAATAPAPLITAPMVEAARSGDGRLVLVDIAVPRNVEPAVRDLPGVHLFNVDDLREGLDTALEARRHAVPQVEAIIEEELELLDLELRRLTVRPLIADLRKRAEAIRRQELNRALRFLGDDLDPETVKHVEHLSRSLVNKLLHEPTLRLREKATNGEAALYETTVRDLFALDSTEG